MAFGPSHNNILFSCGLIDSLFLQSEKDTQWAAIHAANNDIYDG